MRLFLLFFAINFSFASIGTQLVYGDRNQGLAALIGMLFLVVIIAFVGFVIKKMIGK